jgi:hypothetical protein
VTTGRNSDTPRAPVPFFGCGGTPHGRGSFAERTVSGGRLSGRGKGVAKQAVVATGGPLFTVCTERGVGTWWRRNRLGKVSVTWRSVPGRCRRGARLVLTVVPVGPGRRWLFLFGAKERGKRKAGWPGFPRNGKERARKKKEKAGWPGFPRKGRNGPGRKRRKRDVSEVGSGVGGWFGSGTGSGVRIGIGMSSAGSARSFCCHGRAMVGLRADGDSRLGRAPGR